MSKSFLAVGNYLINPELLAYAILENEGGEPRLRLGFASGFPESGGELRLAGEAAREILRWLRVNATFLTKAGGFGSIGASVERSIDRDSRVAPWQGSALAGQRGGLAGTGEPKLEPATHSWSRGPV